MGQKVELPDTITHLVINSAWPFTGLELFPLPPNLKSLTTSLLKEDTPLPASLESLVIANQKWEGNVYPPNLKHLEFIPIEREQEAIHLPPSLESFKIGFNDFTKVYSIPAFPPNLKKLHIPIEFNLPYPFPLSMTRYVGNISNANDVKYIPSLFALPNLEHLTLKIDTDEFKLDKLSLPPKLVELVVVIGRRTHRFGDFIQAIDFCSAPRLKLLTIDGPAVISDLPPTIKELNIKHFISCSLPPALESLKFVIKEMQPIPTFPQTLKHLLLDMPPDSSTDLPPLPHSLKTLYARRSLIDVSTQLPPRLTKLTVAISDFEKYPPFPLQLEHVETRFLRNRTIGQFVI